MRMIPIGTARGPELPNRKDIGVLLPKLRYVVSLRCMMHDFGARTGRPALIAVVEFGAASAAAYFEFV
jgi:hypothetical protein